MSPNSSAVFNETTEAGRLFHKGIALGKKNSSKHHYRPYILCIVNHEMPWYFLCWVLGSGIYLYQETLYRSESCKIKLRRTSPCGPPGMATRVRPTYCRRYSCFSIACRPICTFSTFRKFGRVRFIDNLCIVKNTIRYTYFSIRIH